MVQIWPAETLFYLPANYGQFAGAKIFDRQIGKQAIADRVVDDLNPDAHSTSRDPKSLVVDNEDPPKVFGKNLIQKLTLSDLILGCVLERWGSSLTEIPLQPDTLLLEGMDSLLTEEEKETADRLYDECKGSCVRPPSLNLLPLLLLPLLLLPRSLSSRSMSLGIARLYSIQSRCPPSAHAYQQFGQISTWKTVDTETALHTPYVLLSETS